MKILKYTLATLVFIGGVNAIAQQNDQTTEPTTQVKEKKSPADRADKKVAKLNESISLTDDQQAKIKTLTTTYIESVLKVKADETTTDEVKKSQVKGLRETYEKDLNALLDAEQQAKLAEVKEEKKAQRKASKKKTTAERAAAKSDKMVEKLSLDSDQEEKVRTLNLKVAMKIEAIKKDDSMSKEKKKEFIEGNMNDHMIVMKTILTAEQLVTYEAWVAEKKAEKKAKKDAKSNAAE